MNISLLSLLGLEPTLKPTLLCQIPVIKTGKNFVTFLYGNFLLRVLVIAVEREFAIIIIGISCICYSIFPFNGI